MKTTGGTYDKFHVIMSEMDRRHAYALEDIGGSMLGAYAIIGVLDAPEVLNAGAMTSTPVNGCPIPKFFTRDGKSW